MILTFRSIEVCSSISWVELKSFHLSLVNPFFAVSTIWNCILSHLHIVTLDPHNFLWHSVECPDFILLGWNVWQQPSLVSASLKLVLHWVGKMQRESSSWEDIHSNELHRDQVSTSQRAVCFYLQRSCFYGHRHKGISNWRCPIWVQIEIRINVHCFAICGSVEC